MAKKTIDTTKVTKTAKTTKPKAVKITLHIPGTSPEEIKVSGTLGGLKQERNLTSYDVSLNGTKGNDEAVLQSGDVVLVGFKTKNN